MPGLLQDLEIHHAPKNPETGPNIEHAAAHVYCPGLIPAWAELHYQQVCTWADDRWHVFSV